MSEMHVVYDGSFSTKVYTQEGALELTTDAPIEHGGKGERLSPTDLFAASLGACVVTILSMYAKKMHIPFEGVKAHVVKKGGPNGSIGEIAIDVHYPGSLSSELLEKLEKAAKHCPIHECIDPKIKQTITIKTSS